MPRHSRPSPLCDRENNVHPAPSPLRPLLSNKTQMAMHGLTRACCLQLEQGRLDHQRHPSTGPQTLEVPLLSFLITLPTSHDFPLSTFRFPLELLAPLPTPSENHTVDPGTLSLLGMRLDSHAVASEPAPVVAARSAPSPARRARVPLCPRSGKQSLPLHNTHDDDVQHVRTP
jgi:hypothetical protein